MECPKTSGLVQIIPMMVQREKMGQEIATPMVASSDRWNWKKMDFE